MSYTDVWDVAVVGAGIIGSSAAYQLAKQHTKVILLEQFGLPHTRGSSSGQTRTIRRNYTQEHYAAMMPECYRMWQELAEEAGTPLVQEIGSITVGEPDDKCILGSQHAMQKTGAPYEMLDARQMSMRYPHFRFPSNHVALYDPHAGVLKAQKCLTSYQMLFQKLGGTLLDEVQVLEVRPGIPVCLCTNRGQIRSKAVILATGPWTNKLLGSLNLELPLKTQRVFLSYWKEKSEGLSRADRGFSAMFIPSWRDPALPSSHPPLQIFTSPAIEYPHCAKVSIHGGDLVDVDQPAKQTGHWQMESLGRFIGQHLPCLEDTPSVVEPCIYTMTPDEEFIVDRHPAWDNIIIAAGFSGHGFKLAPVIGKVLAELSLRRPTSYDVTPLSIHRFKSKLGIAKL